MRPRASGWTAAGVGQYEISNFARAGGESRHNRKYWERAPYCGLRDGCALDAAGGGGWGAIPRRANADAMESIWAAGWRLGGSRNVDRVGVEAGFEEALFLGLRLVEGVSLGG